jgi:hypothetical protein
MNEPSRDEYSPQYDEGEEPAKLSNPSVNRDCVDLLNRDKFFKLDNNEHYLMYKDEIIEAKSAALEAMTPLVLKKAERLSLEIGEMLDFSWEEISQKEIDDMLERIEVIASEYEDAACYEQDTADCFTVLYNSLLKLKGIAELG